jgi:hypothetical protein
MVITEAQYQYLSPDFWLLIENYIANYNSNPMLILNILQKK